MGIFIYLIYIPSLMMHIYCDFPKNLSQINQTILNHPKYAAEEYFSMMFESIDEFENLAIKSQFIDPKTKEIKYNGKWNTEITSSTPYINDYQLVLKSPNSYHGVSFKFQKPFTFKSQCIAFQYDFKFPTDHKCGGAYIKLMPRDNFEPLEFSNASLYSIMFGPDKCGMDYKLRFHYNYKMENGEFKERTPIKAANKQRHPRFLGDNVTHVITLHICNNNTYRMFKNLRIVKDGHLVNDFEPSPGGPRMIVDELDSKPTDWDDREEILDPDLDIPDESTGPEFIPDPNAKKPYNWLDSEPTMVRSKDPKPDDWDEKKKGPWIPPMVKNFKCKSQGCGKWKPPLIRNPNYKPPLNNMKVPNPNYMGKWKPRMIPNPKYNENIDVYSNLLPIEYLSIELWSQTPETQIDNFLVTDNLTLAHEFALKTWWPKFLVDTEKLQYYRDPVLDVLDPNRTIKKKKFNIYAYIHWCWASLPLLLGLPILFYILYLISKKSQRDPDAAKERWLLRTYEQLCKELDNEELKKGFDINSELGDFKNFAGDDNNIDYNDSKLYKLTSEEAITQMFGGPDDLVADVLRKRIRENMKQSIDSKQKQIPAGDTSYKMT